MQQYLKILLRGRSSIRKFLAQFVRKALKLHELQLREPLYTKAGIYLGHFYSAPIDESRVERIFTRIVRGLYYKARNQRIPDGYSFEVKRIDLLAFNEAWHQIKAVGYNGPHTIGTDVFTCI